MIVVANRVVSRSSEAVQLVDRLLALADVNKVEQDEIRCTARGELLAVCSVGLDPIPTAQDRQYLQSAWCYSRGDAVRRVRVFGIANDDSAVEQVDVQRVIDHVHVVCRRQRSGDAVDRTGERRVCHAKRCLPDLQEQASLDMEKLRTREDVPSRTRAGCTEHCDPCPRQRRER